MNHHNRMAPTRFPISHTGDSVLSALYEQSDVSFEEPRCPGSSHVDSRDISPGFRTGQLEKRSCPERLERSGPLTLLWRLRPASRWTIKRTGPVKHHIFTPRYLGKGRRTNEDFIGFGRGADISNSHLTSQNQVIRLSVHRLSSSALSRLWLNVYTG